MHNIVYIVRLPAVGRSCFERSGYRASSLLFIYYVGIMKHVVQHVRSHLKGHINDHQHHYLFGLFGGFALFKLFLLLTGITVVQYTIFATAQEEEPIEDPNPIIEMIDDE